MRILIVSMFPLKGSGSGTYCINLAHTYLEEGNEVHVMVPETGAQDRLPGVNIIEVNAGVGKNFPVFTTHPQSTRVFGDMTDRELEDYVRAYNNAITIAINRHGIDMIHFQHLWCISALAAEHDVPSVVTCHGTDILGLSKWPRFKKEFFTAAESCREIMAVSESQAGRLIELDPGLRDKIRVQYNHYDTSVFRLKKVDRDSVLKKIGCRRPAGKIIVFAGKLTEMKGIDILLEADLIMKRGLGRGEELPLLIVAGSGNLYRYAEDFCRENELANVILTGHVSQEMLCDIMNTADAMVMPSRYEPFGYSAVEAMACGLFVIASDVDGLKETITEETGILIEAGNAKALAEAMIDTTCTGHKSEGLRESIADYARSRFAGSGR